MQLPLDTIMVWTRDTRGNRTSGVCAPSDHARSDLSEDTERIGTSDRMANGRMRNFFVADKRSWSVSWDSLPAPDEMTADGKQGAKAIEEFYKTTRGDFQMRLTHKDSGLDETVTVMFKSFSKDIVARGSYDMWDVSVSLDEV